MADPVPVLLFNSHHPQYDAINHLVDVPELIKSKLLITGGSGSGKSRALRALCEQLAGELQQIVFDFEGDLVTLTEVHDYLVAGDGGHVPAHPAQAAVLAQRVMAIGASIICTLSELTIPDRQDFVAAFLGAMMALPREQWRPCLVAIDEVQLVCPERSEGDPVSADAVVDMAARGRKRGYCLVVTSQRIAKVRKDLVAECHNRLIGFISLPADMVRAAGELGLEARDRGALKRLPRGHFYGIGPAIARETMVVRNADVRTKEPDSGAQRTAVAPASVQALLEQLGELPPIASSAATPAASAAAAPNMAAENHAECELGLEVLKRDHEHQLLQVHAAILCAEVQLQKARKLVALGVPLQEAEAKPREAIEDLSEDGARAELQVSDDSGDIEPNHRTISRAIAAAEFGPSAPPELTGIGKTPLSMVACLVQLAAIGVATPTREVLGAWVGLRQSGTFRNYLSEIRQAGLITTSGAGVTLTETGRKIGARASAPFASRVQLQQHWLSKLGKTPRAMLDYLLRSYPNPVSRELLGDVVGISHTSGTFRNYLSELRAPGLIVTTGASVQASSMLFPVGMR